MTVQTASIFYPTFAFDEQQRNSVTIFVIRLRNDRALDVMTIRVEPDVHTFDDIPMIRRNTLVPDGVSNCKLHNCESQRESATIKSVMTRKSAQDCLLSNW